MKTKIIFYAKMKRLIALILFLFSFGCNDPSTEKIEKKEIFEVVGTEHISVLEETPVHIQEIENLTIFSGNSKPIYNIELNKEYTFGSGDEFNFYWIFDCFADNNGRLIVWGSDFTRGEGVYVFNSDGTFNTQLGKQGRGPGEYTQIIQLVGKEEKIFITDYGNMRLNEYSTKDYSFIKSTLFETLKTKEKNNITSVLGRNDGNYLVSFADPRSQIGWRYSQNVILDEKGKRVSNNSIQFKVGMQIKKVGGSMRPTLPLTFLGNTFTALSSNDELYTAWSPEFLIKKYDLNNIYQSAIYYPILGVPFDLGDYTESTLFSPEPMQIKQALSDMDIEMPEFSPLVEEIIIDNENRIWVSIAVGKEKKKYEWWILKESGELLAKFSVNQNQRLYDIKNGYVYIRKDNGKNKGELYSENGPNEADNEYVVKYRIKFIGK